MVSTLSLLFGAVVGLSLGLTGGGGAIFAVPLLVYGTGIPAREAVAVSLAAVGATAFVGFLHRWKLGEVELPTGLVFAVAGMVGAPAGTWIAGLINESALLVMFAALMAFVALRMWPKAEQSAVDGNFQPPLNNQTGSACQRNAADVLILNSSCMVRLVIAGIFAGILSGMFGIGGGFIIVPALVLFSHMAVHRAVATSLMVIALISVSGVFTQLWSGRALPLQVTSLFIVGGLAGLFTGQRIARRLSGPVLQRVFSVAILIVALFIILRHSPREAHGGSSVEQFGKTYEQGVT